MKKLLLLLLLFGCAGPMDRPDSGVGPVDTGVKTILFEADQVEGPSLLFGDAALTPARLDVDITAHRLARVYGLAYRLEFDPAVLQLEGLDRSPAFIHDDLFEVKEAEPGRWVVAMSAVGPLRGVDLDGAAVARLRLIRKTAALTEIRIARAYALDEDGAEIRPASGKGAIVER